MKVLLCTNVFETITNGPAKFAHLALQMQEIDTSIEIRILTEDVAQEINHKVYKLNFHIPFYLNKLSQFKRMFAYYHKAKAIHKSDFPFDILLFNHALIGLWSALRFNNTWGFINDYKNVMPSLDKVGRTVSIKRYVFHKFEKLSTQYLKNIIVNSKYLEKQILECYPAAKNKTVVFHKGIEFAPLQELPEKPKHIIPEIVFVKNDYERAGLFVLIQALKKLPMQTKLIVIGPFAGAITRIEAACKGSNITLCFVGVASQETIYTYFRKADVFCLPSLSEAFGVANIEAMALGCPVVTTTAGGIPEVLLNESNGWMTQPGNVDDLYAALLDCLTNPEKRTQKAKNALQRAQAFTKEKTLKRFSDILHDNA